MTFILKGQLPRYYNESVLPIPVTPSAWVSPMFDSWKDRGLGGNSIRPPAMHEVRGFQSVTLSTNSSLSRAENKNSSTLLAFIFNLKEMKSTGTTFERHFAVAHLEWNFPWPAQTREPIG